MSASPEQNKDVGTPSRKRQRVNEDRNSIQIDSDHPHLNKLTSILNDLIQVDDKDKELDTMDLCHVPPTINAILQEMSNDSIHTHDSNQNIISLLVQILVKFHLLHSTNQIKLPNTTEQNFQNAFRQKAKQWVCSSLGKLMKPNGNTSIVSIDALIADSFLYNGILDVDTLQKHMLQVMQDKILYEEQEERITMGSNSLEFCNDCDLSNDVMGLVSSQLESFQHEQRLDSTSLVDLVLNK